MILAFRVHLAVGRTRNTEIMESPLTIIYSRYHMQNLDCGLVCTTRKWNIHMVGLIIHRLLLPTGPRVNQITVGQAEIPKTVSLCCRKMASGMMLIVKITANTYVLSQKPRTSPKVGTIRAVRTGSPHFYTRMEAFTVGCLMRKRKLINRQRLIVLVEPMTLNLGLF